MEQSLYFYRDLLGLKIQGTTDEDGDFIEKLLSGRNISLKTIKLSADDDATRIELIKFSKPEHIETKRNGLHNLGLTHLALTVDDLEKIYQQLMKMNIYFNCPPQISPNGKLKVVFCQDPEGNYLELIEEI